MPKITSIVLETKDVKLSVRSYKAEDGTEILDEATTITVYLDDGTTFVLAIDALQDCCEWFGFTIDETLIPLCEGNYNFHLSRMLDNILVKDKGVIPFEFETAFFKEDDNRLYFYDKDEKKLAEIYMYNDHNGFYPHQAMVQLRDKSQIFFTF